ncbi:MAG: exopolysaccharide biosynthesis polyprenyl glycosylphosphotransferase [Bacteroidota bacterium]|jgi:putative colanic acid biosynthesis UDP-glucose lipid carrier transferase|nr:exopolysaccharide biosynthesis polyprenyl glycosylphosphotransferase [Algoriphagus sp.]
MKKRFDVYFPWLFTISDFLASLLSLALANFFLQRIQVLGQMQFSAFLPLALLWILISILRKDYKIGRTDEYDQTLSSLSISLLWFLGATAILWTPLQVGNYRWIQIGSLGTILGLLMGIFRVAVHMMLRKYRASGNNYQNAVIVGKGTTSPKLVDVLRIRKDFGINFLGYFDDQSDCEQTRGGIVELFNQAPKLNLDLIYIHEKLDAGLVKQVIDFAEEHYIKVKMIPGQSLQLEKSLSFSRYGDFFVINVNEIPLDSLLNRMAKRVFDLAFAGMVTLFILTWLIPLVGFLIKLESRGPIFFIQKRNGLNNRVFNCLKFRSMTPNDYADSLQATKEDPRVTRIGAFLRHTSLDEMPQFLNVIMGDMSIVGPRPHTLPMNESFKNQIVRYNARHKIKPGITGLAQVKGYRGEIENTFQIRSRVRLDAFYINNWTFLLDIEIMIKTVYELIFNRENAY